MKFNWLLIVLLFFSSNVVARNNDSTYYKADHKNIQYTGRVDFANVGKPKFWGSGTYVKIKFSGTYCVLLVNDEVLWNKVHNYLEIKIDDQQPKRIQLQQKENRIVLAESLPEGKHTIIICKDTEAENGYLEVTGFICKKLEQLPAKPRRKIEFIGDSITCGFGADESVIPCGKGQWFDEHNAWSAYGPITARNSNAQWHLTSVSGIGLVHSCCNKSILMPQVFDKISIAKDSIPWDFSSYQPDLVTVCLGQNDGIQDSTLFCNAYVNFARRLRAYYPHAKMILPTSPMAGQQLRTALSKYITAVKVALENDGEKNIGTYVFAKQYIKGCGSHPSLAEQQEIADALSSYVKAFMNW